MSEWNFLSAESKDNLLGVVRREAEALMALASGPGAWEAPTACPDWQVRDVVGHLVAVTEGYFVGFDAARGRGTAGDPRGLAGFAERTDEAAKAFRGVPQAELNDRLRADFEKMMGTFEALAPEEWTGLMVSHADMGPLPACFFPLFQLVDYGIHSWDIREGTGRAHALTADAADLLVPLAFILWQATAVCGPDTEPYEIGVRVSGNNAGETRIGVGPEGVTTEAGAVDGLPAVLEFDPASLILTAYGRMNAGSCRGDASLAERFLNQCFRI